jgi:hypothetical protein
VGILKSKDMAEYFFLAVSAVAAVGIVIAYIGYRRDKASVA